MDPGRGLELVGTRSNDVKEDAIGNKQDSKLRETRVVFYRDDVDRINKVLEEFLKLSESKCNILIDKDGHPLTQAGSTAGIDLDTISALVAGSFAATREMARYLGEEEFSVLFHQGKKDSIQLSLIADRCILVTMFDERTTIGMVRLYAKEATKKLTEIFNEILTRGGELKEGLGEGFKEAASGALDDVFGR